MLTRRVVNIKEGPDFGEGAVMQELVQLCTVAVK
jgi:hypothetical protein